MLRSLLAAAAFAGFAAAQTYTPCNPLNKTCPAEPALGTTFRTTFNTSMAEMDTTIWNVTSGKQRISFGQTGAQLLVQSVNESVTVESQFKILFGQVEVIFQAAPGQGIISTAILLSDDLDEIDWEFIGSNTTTVSNNWYGHGDTNQHNGDYPALANGQSSMHNYTFDWTKDRLQWILDGNVVRTLNAAASGQYPQTPAKVSFGIWSGGDAPSEGTRQWAGGATDWSAGPYVMTVQSIRITDGTSNSSTYTYGDQSGSYQSIQVKSGQSKASEYISKLSTTQSAMNSWASLSSGAKIGIACGVAGVLAILIIAWCAFCCVQRRKGREEKRLADKEWDEQQNELMSYRRLQQKGQFAVSHMSFGSNKF